MDIFASVRSKGGAVRDHPAIGSVRDDQIFGGHFAVTTRNQLKLDLLAFVEGLVALTRDVGVVDEHVVSTLAGDEAEALLAVEEFHGALHGFAFDSSTPT